MTRHRLLVNTITISYICLTLIEFGTEIEFMVLVDQKKSINETFKFLIIILNVIMSCLFNALLIFSSFYVYKMGK